MKLFNYKILKAFSKTHPDAEVPLNRWAQLIEEAQVAVVVFFAGQVHLRFVGTHEEYDKIKNIKEI